MKIDFNKKVQSGSSEIIGRMKTPICKIELVKGYFNSDWETVSVGLRARFKDGSYIDYSTLAYTKNKNWKNKVKDRVKLIKKSLTELTILDKTIQHNRKNMWKFLKVIQESRTKIAKVMGATDFFIAENTPIKPKKLSSDKQEEAKEQ